MARSPAPRAAAISSDLTGRLAGALDAVVTIDAEVEASTASEPLRAGSRRNGLAFLTAHHRLGTPGAEPYRRKVPTFQRHFDRTLDAQLVALGTVRRDQSAFRVKHEPGNPAADANGDVRMPNVNALVEMVDMREAQRSYEANLNLISSTRRMIQRTIDILRA